MSYILDALRKSDQLRRRSGAPTLMLGQAEAAAPKRPAPLWYGVFALVLLCAGIAIGWLRPWQQGPAPAASSATPPAAQTPAPNPAPAMQVATAPATQIASVPAPAPAPSIAAPAAPEPAQARGARPIEIPVASPRASAEISRKTEPPLREPARSSDKGAKAGAMPPAAAMTLAELPLAIQQDLPPMSVSVHAYSAKAGERLVGINSRLLHEGDEVAPGLKLEQITPDGMILSYKGYTFRRGVH